MISTEPTIKHLKLLNKNISNAYEAISRHLRHYIMSSIFEFRFLN